MNPHRDALAGNAPEIPAGIARVVPAGIARQITAEGGRVTLARFMDLALTHPTDGYYGRPDALLGPRGDFSTAPRLSPDFSEALGRLVEELISAAVTANDDRPAGSATAAKVALIELGGGEGDFARAVLRKWQRERPDLRERVVYAIVEVGEGLRARQRRALAPLIEAGWRVAWASTLEEGLADAGAPVGTGPGAVDAGAGPGATGMGLRAAGPGATGVGLRGAGPAVVVGNEFIDALPVHLVDVRGPRPLEAWVEVGPAGAAGHDAVGGPGVAGPAGVADPAGAAGPGACPGEGTGGGLREVWGALSPDAEAELRRVLGTTETAALRPLSRDGFIELRPSVGALLGELAADGGTRCLLTVDYGDWFGAARGATAGRSSPYRRTLRGYFRHQLVTDPYARVGRQDLTADVDFRALDIHGRCAGFETVLYTTVADMLRGDSGEERLHALRNRARASLASDRRATVLGKLLDDEGLGGAFRVMLQVRE